jgi:hypothetical protein
MLSNNTVDIFYDHRNNMKPYQVHQRTEKGG